MKFDMKSFLNKYIYIGIAAFALSFSFSSCTDYLDKEPDSDVDTEAAFKNFNNFQGFVELAYNCIPNKESNYWCCTFNWGEDEIMNAGLGDSHLTHQMDIGNYRHWYSDAQSYLHSGQLDPTSSDKFSHSLEHAWFCIRHCNLGLQNLDKFQGSNAEREAIEGQLLFFRAWWHNELMNYFGGLPYIDKAFEPSDELLLPRLSFKECAEKCAADYERAAQLLPENWDTHPAGLRTKGHNDLRITKVCALGYLGKVLLYAASPFNVHGASTGVKNLTLTYEYDKELAGRAADALGKALAMVEAGGTPYALAEYKYSDIYNHIADKSSTTNFSDIFYTTGKNWQMPGSVEAIMRGPMPDINGSNWNFAKLWGPKVNGLVEHDAVIHMPTANYVNYAYGMANGLPLNDPDSGFDPTHPFKDRDPRFYHDIMFDGFKFINNDPDAANKMFQYLPLQSPNGTDPEAEKMRDASSGSRTGYFCQKLVPHQCNKFDGMYNWGGALQTYLPYMRLADIYLMYAEAGAAVQGANYKSSSYNKTALDAINILRDRVGAAHVADKFTTEQNKFMDEVRRERACELAFEGFRWNDLQRWLLLTERPYNIKTSQEFRRVGDFDFAKNDPRDAEVTGWREEIIVERVFSTQHYLFPFHDNDVYLYAEFGQNPGW